MNDCQYNQLDKKMFSFYVTFYIKNKATMTGIVIIERSVVIKTVFAAKATSF